jgi:hypothetical protein
MGKRVGAQAKCLPHRIVGRKCRAGRLPWRMLHIKPHPQTRRPPPRVSSPNFSERVTLEEKRCRYCSLKFRPSRYHPDQAVCSSADCQRRRRTDYHRKKLIKDPAYREQCLDSQKKWRERNPHYMKRYWAKRGAQARLEAKRYPLTSELHQLLKLLKNNVAVDLRSLDASIWFVGPNGLLSEKNNVASAKIIIVQGFRRFSE